MFSRWTRLPIRRCIHTATPRPRPQNRLQLVLATTAVTATYLAWPLTSDSHSIALDSTSKLSPLKQSNLSPSHQPVFPMPSSADDPTPPAHRHDADVKTKSSQPSEKAGNTSTADPGSETTHDAGGGGGAYNPVTGEINWDCPCLGGMAHGPCGLQFREAFSCFVFSEEEPKGINCVDKFKAMQNCFREHPEVYGDEIMDDDEEDAESIPDSNTPEKIKLEIQKEPGPSGEESTPS